MATVTFRSESKKKASARSTMLKTVMPKLSGDTSEKLASAISENDGDAVMKIMVGIGKELKKDLEKKGKK